MISRISSFILLISLISFSYSVNPIVQTIFTADPAPILYKDRVYVYTGHDAATDNRNTMPDWYCFSTTDMQNWENHGVVLSCEDFKWAQKNTAWAAQVIERNKVFYYYVTITTSGGRSIAVATSDSPTGPFKDALGKPLCGPNWDYIDPTVFIDDDGQAYLYFGNPQLYYVKLNEDMISYSGQINKVEMKTESFGTRNGGDERHRTNYEEAPWLYKRNDIYYLLYAAAGVPESIAYSTGPSATGPWTWKGFIMNARLKGSASSIHPGVVEYKGKNYYFYHDGKLPGGGNEDRSVAVEEFEYNADGTIPLFKEMTNEGPKQIEPFDPFKQTPATTICFEKGISTRRYEDGTNVIINIKNGCYIRVRGVDFKEGASKLTVNAASETKGGKIEAHLDKVDGDLVSSCEISNTGGWYEYKSFECEVSNAKGLHDLFFVFVGGNDFLFDFKWWKFE